MSHSVYKEILKQYDKIQMESQRLLNQKQEKIYKLIPRIKKIDELLGQTGLTITRAIIANPSHSNVLIQELEIQNNALKDEKAQLLEQNGYSKDYLTLSYICQECKDTGYIDNKMCKCMQQKLIEKAYLQSNLKDVLLYENFDNFDIRYYSEEVDAKEGISAKENIMKIMKTCMQFSRDFEQDYKNLILYGNPGLGKTFLCNCIAKELLDRGKTVLYVTAFQLFKLIEEERFNKDSNEEINEYLDTLLTVDLLIIDDLGTEFSTVITSSELYNIINSRLLNKKSTIISTNLPPSNWVDIYSDRVVSRIQGNYIVLKFFGEDIRIKKKYKK